MQYNPYKIKQETYLVMYSDRVKKEDTFKKSVGQKQALIQLEIFIILIKLIELLYNRHLE